jgi:hypothetical protein
VTAPNENRAIRTVEFTPSSTEAGRAVTVTVPGLASAKVDVIYRILADGKAKVHAAEGWCELDSQGACSITAPPSGKMATLAVDWIRPSKGRWIFTHGTLQITAQ